MVMRHVSAISLSSGGTSGLEVRLQALTATNAAVAAGTDCWAGRHFQVVWAGWLCCVSAVDGVQVPVLSPWQR